MMRRLASVDVLRAIAVLLMIQVHFVENLSPQEAPTAELYEVSLGLGSLAAPIFTFVVGLSLWLWLRRQVALGRDGAEMDKTVARRGLFLFGAGLAFAVLIWLPGEVFDWDILTFIGASTLILLPLRRLSPRTLVGLAVVSVLLSAPLRAMTGYESHWTGREYVYRFTTADVVLGFLLHGYFPLLPWIAFPLVGYAVGKHFLGDGYGRRFRGWGIPVVGVGLAALAGMGASVSRNMPAELRWYADELSFYPASTTFVLGSLGLVCLGLWVLHRWLDRREASPDSPVLRFLSRYSRFSLTTYFVHHAAHVWPLLLLAAWEDRGDPWWYYGDALSTPVALCLALLFVTGFYAVLVVWERCKGSSFEGVLRWLSGA